MKLSKKTIMGLAAVMTASAMGAAPIYAQEPEAYSAERFAVYECSYSISEESDSASAASNDMVYVVKNDAGICDNTAYTITAASEVGEVNHIKCMISPDDQTGGKLMVSFDGGKTWKKFPMSFNFKFGE